MSLITDGVGALAGLLKPKQPDLTYVIRGVKTLSLSWTDKKSGQTKSARFDVVSQETHESIMAITSHPVEEGSNVVDHARPEPERITIEGYVSNKPLFSNPGVEKLADFTDKKLDVPKPPSPLSPTPGGITRSVTGLVDSLLHPPPSKATVLAPTGDFPDRAKAMWALLKDAQQKRSLITVTTKLEELDNMIVARLSAPRTLADGSGSTIQLELERVRIVSSETVAAPVAAEARAGAEVSKGSKAAIAKEDANKNKKLASFAVNLFDGASNAISSVIP